MNTQRGYSLLELAIVLVVISLLIGAFTAGFAHYRDRAEFIGAGRNSDLDDLVAELKAVPEHAQVPEAPADPATPPAPLPEPAPEEAAEPDDNDADRRPFWTRWLAWWRDTGQHDNRRRRR